MLENKVLCKTNGFVVFSLSWKTWRRQKSLIFFSNAESNYRYVFVCAKISNNLRSAHYWYITTLSIYIAFPVSSKTFKLHLENQKFKFLSRKLIGMGWCYASETCTPVTGEWGSSGSNSAPCLTSVWPETQCSPQEKGRRQVRKSANPADTAE